MKKKQVTTISENACNVLYATLSAGVIFFAFFSINHLNSGELNYDYSIYTALAFLCLGLSYCPYLFLQKEKLQRIKCIVFFGVDLACGITSLLLPPTGLAFSILGGLFGLTLVINRVFAGLERKESHNYIKNGLLALIALAFSISIFALGGNDDPTTALFLLLLLQVFVGLSHILQFAFSKIRFKLLLKILKKTYAFEILYGLLLLIVSFSIVFYYYEPAFETYFDGLWYCFAIVTTIGFGDYSAVTILGRVLSILLGIYGTIVMALITSIIVNFYSEITAKEEKSMEVDLTDAEIEAEPKREEPNQEEQE